MPAAARFSFEEVSRADFLDIALARLGREAVLDITPDQEEAWDESLEWFQWAARQAITNRPATARWSLLLEFRLWRKERRIDAVVVGGGRVFVHECKTARPTTAAHWQVAQYAWDLRDFHSGSQGFEIVPIVVSPEGRPRTISVRGLSSFEITPLQLEKTWMRHATSDQAQPDGQIWESAAYRPTPTIIEAATELYETHDVRDISHTFATNLDRTTTLLARQVLKAREKKQRAICFVTGVPGAGKTLTGLAAVHDRSIREAEAPAGVFLTGNLPLRKVLVEALAKSMQRKGRGLNEARHEAETFIQSVHRFIEDQTAPGSDPPVERVIVFDEAQRAWDAAKVRRSSKRARPGQPRRDYGKSEAAILLDIMERVPEWSVVIALIGGGQEIHEGEAGLEEWGRALEGRNWQVYASPEALAGGASVAGHRLHLGKGVAAEASADLHLAVSTRSPRGARLATWVEHVLDGDSEAARTIARELSEFPLAFCRDLDLARAWLRFHATPGDRAGLVASSGADRHRAYGLEMNTAFHGSYSLEDWFLAGPDDIRSSHQLEYAAHEFECQGLELDWVGLCWAGDFFRSPEGWQFRDFKAKAWQAVHQKGRQQFLLNKYRVLLTRARKGMIIWIPRGRPEDRTLNPAEFDSIATYLAACGVPEIHAVDNLLVIEAGRVTISDTHDTGMGASTPD